MKNLLSKNGVRAASFHTSAASRSDTLQVVSFVINDLHSYMSFIEFKNYANLIDNVYPVVIQH